MLRGFYTAASGMMANQRMQETLSNNLANAYTPGYKADQGTMRAFPELLIQQMNQTTVPTRSGGLNLPAGKQIGSLHTGVYMQETVPKFSQGDLRETGIKTDLALLNGNLPDDNGSLFFNVQDEAGNLRYTRNGNFTVDGEGFLTTTQGYYVLDDAGSPIQTGGMDFDVSENGTLTAADVTTQLGLSYSPNSFDLEKVGNGLYAPGEDAAPIVDARAGGGINFSISQGFLERSNVAPARVMTEMMNTYRSFELNQRVLKAYDQSLQKTVTEIARIR
ncbi:flagellar hook-basal body protein [Halobacillus naozhouensis]|uniref:Flagellar hook-basal body protein n=1 Tax=Halobacillus naozhouensis TaxID=554880 RepID=A0ABY8IVW8_9BACI|nr:flagellar hook-basal body protein [Halobacillus naozhouensis]WFT74353.1 flagellar hook-basal body protein [Halobacillus naozhouensis]